MRSWGEGSANRWGITGRRRAGRRIEGRRSWFRRGEDQPTATIGGMWPINDAGFVPGRKARITIEPGRLIVTAM
ncbi:hypothetical protein WL19_05495 [Burkholderia ubonensis]|uniref:NfeD-like C-terminal domain-containing protein n=1 Tax=Burkholderia ubonensis TaxID=101571 RepID=A0ABD4E292_9BURK|nr:hypothetical protein WJ68_09695 [Burkholderia ubonensis]KVU93847.1 hypothetical protein WK75_13040 [Burkholderia ubonensis]KVV42417.1 hypothetical protein WK81_14695 [Burkholderia ubonensis]KVZ57886.1 hypothetical protein WL19_05495 [Burkholderia ubonensis]KVZ76629.1 hypothetical protein WL24_24495 [Burkholderia ubonensis]